jgi:putative oxidoreductase
MAEGSNKAGLTDTGLLLIRCVCAVVLAYHGAGKLFGWFGGSGFEAFASYVGTLDLPEPRIMAYAAAVSEFFCSILLFLGLGGRWPALPMAATMIIAVVKVHPDKFAGASGMEFPLTLGVVCLGLTFTGPGNYTLMRLFK